MEVDRHSAPRNAVYVALDAQVVVFPKVEVFETKKNEWSLGKLGGEANMNAIVMLRVPPVPDRFGVSGSGVVFVDEFVEGVS